MRGFYNRGFYSWQADTLTLRVYIQPRAGKDEVVGPHTGGPQGDALKIRITSPPLDGKANAHLAGYLAKLFDVPRQHVTLQKGAHSRSKLFSITRPRHLPDMIRQRTADE